MRQHVGHTAGEITQGIQAPASRPDTSQADRMLGVRIVDGHERTLVDQAERVGRSHADTTICGIGIGVPHPQRATGDG